MSGMEKETGVRRQETGEKENSALPLATEGTQEGEKETGVRSQETVEMMERFRSLYPLGIDLRR